MKTFNPNAVEQCLFFQCGEQGHLLVKVRGRGWFKDTRHSYKPDSMPPKKSAVVSCLTSQCESGFEKVKVTSYKIPRRKIA